MLQQGSTDPYSDAVTLDAADLEGVLEDYARADSYFDDEDVEDDEGKEDQDNDDDEDEEEDEEDDPSVFKDED